MSFISAQKLSWPLSVSGAVYLISPWVCFESHLFCLLVRQQSGARAAQICDSKKVWHCCNLQNNVTLCMRAVYFASCSSFCIIVTLILRDIVSVSFLTALDCMCTSIMCKDKPLTEYEYRCMSLSFLPLWKQRVLTYSYGDIFQSWDICRPYRTDGAKALISHPFP